MMSETPKTARVANHLIQTEAPRQLASALIRAYQLENRPNLAQTLGAPTTEPVLETVAAWVTRELGRAPLALDGAVINWLAYRLQKTLEAQKETGHV